MNTHDIQVLGYATLLFTAVVFQLLSMRHGSRIPSLQGLLTWVMRTRPGRVGVIAGWAWVGLHYFAR